MEWLGKATTKFTHAKAPRPVKEKDGSETDLLKIVEQATPPCELNPLLFNGHLQTIWTVTKPQGPKVYYKRKIFDANHETYKGTFAVDFVSEPFEGHDEGLLRRNKYFTDKEWSNIGSDDSKPMLIVLHGLSGGSHEVYLRHTIAPLIEEGWEIAVVISRGCANTKLTSGVLYNARATWDVRQVVNWAKDTFPNRPLFGLGFSLGANMLTVYCGEEGSKCPLKAAVVCSNPFNLEVSNKFLQSSLIGRELYLRFMGSAMKQLAATHKPELEKMTDLDFEAIENITYLQDFDRLIQCPTWGYPTEFTYYRDASSVEAILSIRIPFVAIQAEDDPIAVKQALPYEEFEQNPSTVMITTSLGGHLCWFESGGGRWFPKPVCNFLNHMARKVEPSSMNPLDDAATTYKPTRGADYNPMRRKLELVGSMAK